tara:strand:+ start:14392 stop:14610 length:219 start_codon:yes stop_codon:yes gene_type:complete
MATTKSKKPEKNIISKEELKDVVHKPDEILEQKLDQVGSSGGVPSTWTKKRLHSGAIQETFGERDGRPNTGK